MYACDGSMAYVGGAAALAIPVTFINTIVHANDDTDDAEVAVRRCLRALPADDDGNSVIVSKRWN